MELVLAKREEFPDIYSAMEQSFPKEEIRDLADATAVLDEERFFVYHTVSEGVRVGFITLWELDGFTFCEHLVTYPEHRSKGYGAEVIKACAKKFSRLVLECEHPDTPMAKRRLGFYLRCGFFENSYPYVQPPYREGEKGVPLLLLSYPDPLDSVEKTVDIIYELVYKIKRIKGDKNV